LTKEKDIKKYEVGRELVYSATKRYIKEAKLEPSEEDFHKLLAA